MSERDKQLILEDVENRLRMMQSALNTSTDAQHIARIETRIRELLQQKFALLAEGVKHVP
jgi:hypothetical protein